MRIGIIGASGIALAHPRAAGTDPLNGERSVAWIQARMKLTSAMAALEWAAGAT